jgi:hypothetical protein
MAADEGWSRGRLIRDPIHPEAASALKPARRLVDATNVRRVSTDARMCNYSVYLEPSDICLILRAHAEERWLTLEVLPVLGRLQAPAGVPATQRAATQACLEAAWSHASRLAAKTDSASAELARTYPAPDQHLQLQAWRYHAAVRVLRETLGERVRARIPARGDLAWACARARP